MQVSGNLYIHDMAKLNINDFELGDKVNHVSNSNILMAVVQIHKEQNQIICRWMDSKGNVQDKPFIPEELEKEKPLSTRLHFG